MRSKLNFERPDGWSKGSPEILVSEPVIENMGMPVVDYDSLHQLMTDDLSIPYDDPTEIRLHGRSKIGPGGHMFPFSKIITVNPIMAETRMTDEGGTMMVLSHELRHRSDAINRRLRTAAETTARGGVFLGTYCAILAYGDPNAAKAVFASFGGLLAGSLYYWVDPSERRARAQEDLDSTHAHLRDILFPISPRTDALIANNELDKKTIVKLGRSKFDQLQASDFVIK